MLQQGFLNILDTEEIYIILFDLIEKKYENLQNKSFDISKQSEKIYKFVNSIHFFSKFKNEMNISILSSFINKKFEQIEELYNILEKKNDCVFFLFQLLKDSLKEVLALTFCCVPINYILEREETLLNRIITKLIV